jgi:hypothetical protein
MADSEDKSTDVRHVQDRLHSAFESTVPESVSMRVVVAPTSEDATRASVASAVKQMASIRISDQDRWKNYLSTHFNVCCNYYWLLLVWDFLM